MFRPTNLSAVYLGLGRKQEALQWLRKALRSVRD